MESTPLHQGLCPGTRVSGVPLTRCYVLFIGPLEAFAGQRSSAAPVAPRSRAVGGSPMGSWGCARSTGPKTRQLTNALGDGQCGVVSGCL